MIHWVLWRTLPSLAGLNFHTTREVRAFRRGGGEGATLWGPARTLLPHTPVSGERSRGPSSPPICPAIFAPEVPTLEHRYRKLRLRRTHPCRPACPCPEVPPAWRGKEEVPEEAEVAAPEAVAPAVQRPVGPTGGEVRPLGQARPGLPGPHRPRPSLPQEYGWGAARECPHPA